MKKQMKRVALHRETLRNLTAAGSPGPVVVADPTPVPASQVPACKDTQYFSCSVACPDTQYFSCSYVC